jgi:hypothetical protein
MSEVIETVAPVVPVVAPQVVPVVPDFNTPVPKPKEAPTPEVEPVVKPAVADAIPEDVTGNSALDIAISAFVSVTGATNSDMERATSNAIQYGDPSLVDVAFLMEKFGKHGAQAVALAKAAVTDNAKQTAATNTATLNAVHTAAGSEAQWNQAVSVFNSSASATMKEAVKALMNNGNVAGGAELLMQTVNGSGLLSQSNPLLSGGGTSTQVGGALSAAQFKEGMDTLRKEAGNKSFETGPLANKYNQLIAQRRAGKNLNI